MKQLIATAVLVALAGCGATTPTEKKDDKSHAVTVKACGELVHGSWSAAETKTQEQYARDAEGAVADFYRDINAPLGSDDMKNTNTDKKMAEAQCKSLGID